MLDERKSQKLLDDVVDRYWSTQGEGITTTIGDPDSFFFSFCAIVCHVGPSKIQGVLYWLCLETTCVGENLPSMDIDS